MNWRMDCLSGNKRKLSLAAMLLAGFWGGAPAQAASIFINEIHYDNFSTDSGEAVEIAGPMGDSLAGWKLVFYNGSDGEGYSTRSLGGTFADQLNGFGTLAFSKSGIQNGNPDGIALVDAADEVVQFLSYGGVFSALNGIAIGVTSSDIGVSENGSTPVGHSLQLKGTGSSSDDFIWAAAMEATFGEVNSGQFFPIPQTLSEPDPLPTPEPGTFLLLGTGVAALLFLRRRGGVVRPSDGNPSPG